MQDLSPPPVVLSFSGLGPTGGAGLQADIEALLSMGCHAAPIATCLTVQDTNNIIEITPVDPGLFILQARAVLEDMPVAVFKSGCCRVSKSLKPCIHYFMIIQISRLFTILFYQQQMV